MTHVLWHKDWITRTREMRIAAPSGTEYFYPFSDSISIGIEFKWQDMWIGFFYKEKHEVIVGFGHFRYRFHDLYICLVPMLPIHLSYATVVAP